MYDVIIIGAGVTGCAVARELSRYKVNVCVLDKEEDVCSGTSKANSAIIHAGFDAPAGSLMARFNVRGNEMMDDYARDLDIPFKRNGAMVVCIHESEKDGLKDLYDRGIANGVKGLEILDREQALEKEPNLSENVVAALYAPTSGIICPFLLNIAMAENANVNGVDFFFNTEVEKLTPATCEKCGQPIWKIRTNNGEYKAKYVINAAGVYADVFHNMVSEKKINITPRRGDYCLLDKTAGGHVSHTIFSQPTKFGKGVLVSPTVHGNLIVGPTAIDIENREGINTTADFDRVLKCGADKVSVNSGAIRDPSLVGKAAKLYGDQCVVLSVDVKRVDGVFRIFAKGGRENTGMEAIEWVRRCVGEGAGEVVVNSMDTDGVKQGFDLELLEKVCDVVKVPVIASGGAGCIGDFITLFKALPGVDAGLAASIFHFGEVAINDLKREMQKNGIPARI